MAHYEISGETLTGLANAIRSVTGATKTFTPNEMIDEVTDILNAATFVLVDKDGNEYSAAYLDSDIVFTATANDIRLGKTAITAEGVITGEKEIPAYHTTAGYRKIAAGSDFVLKIRNGRYAYTDLQALFCEYNNSTDESVSTDRVVIDSKVYSVNSIEAISSVDVNHDDETIVFNITNDSDMPYLIRYFTYKEEY